METAKFGMSGPRDVAHQGPLDPSHALHIYAHHYTGRKSCEMTCRRSTLPFQTLSSVSRRAVAF